MIRTAVIRAISIILFAGLATWPVFSQAVTISSDSLSFGSKTEGSSSASEKVTLKNGQDTAIALRSISTSLPDYNETNNCPVSPATLAAGNACSISITFAPTALGVRNGNLTVVDSGTSSPQLVSLTGTGTAANLLSIALSPNPAAVFVGYTEQFIATGTYSDGTTKDVTTIVSWASSAPSVALMTGRGITKGVAAGVVTIKASTGAICGSATLTVTAVVLTSISITPSNASITAGHTQPFTATGLYNNGTTQNLSSKAAWASSAMSVAIVSTGGVASAAMQGTATVTATQGTIIGAAELTVTPPLLVSMAVTPTATSLSVGRSTQFTAIGTYSNGSTQNLTTQATWTSSSAPVAMVGSSGLVIGAAPGTVTVTAGLAAVRGSATLIVTDATGQIPNFQHVIVIVQENRTPDNLFQGLCSAPYGTSDSCSTTPTGSQYDIKTANWLDKTSSTGTTQPVTVPLANHYDLNHSHSAFLAMCDLSATGECLMDGAASVTCSETCPTRPQYAYVDNSTGTVNPYLALATQYGWANYMFQTNQGPSFPAHQFIFGGTSAPSTGDDAAGIFAAENPFPISGAAGCGSPAGTTIAVIGPGGENSTIYPRIYPCFEHPTMADLFDSAGVSWRYYTAGPNSIWTAPNAIQHLCVPNASTGGACTGSDWNNDVILTPSRVLTDIRSCSLQQVSWVIPTGQNSDHADINNGGGPSWVASIVNAVGTEPKCTDGEVYWNNTAILITWDDWGGWYDHEAPAFLGFPQGDYQSGFRVPFLAVSAYTPTGYVDNNRLDFGSILRFIQYNFGIEEGSLNFADARAQIDLTEFFDLTQPPRLFQTISADFDEDYFLNDKSPMADPDDD